MIESSIKTAVHASTRASSLSSSSSSLSRPESELSAAEPTNVETKRLGTGLFRMGDGELGIWIVAASGAGVERVRTMARRNGSKLERVGIFDGQYLLEEVSGDQPGLV